MSHQDQTRRFPSLETVVQDVRYALRGFRREPAMTLIAVLILAIGIGANTAVFSIANPLLLRPLPFPNADRLVWMANTGTSGLSGATYRVDLSEEFARNMRSFEGLSAYFAFFGFSSNTLTGRGEPERLNVVPVGPRLFEVLGVRPRSGRLFTSAEHHRGAPRAALLTYGVVSYGVSQRVPEIGVRIALGATARDVRRQILADTLKMAAAGIALGTAASLALSSVINTLLFATSATDPWAFGGMVLLLGLVATVAGYLPARRASRIDPMRALRAE